MKKEAVIEGVALFAGMGNGSLGKPDKVDNSEGGLFKLQLEKNRSLTRVQLGVEPVGIIFHIENL